MGGMTLMGLWCENSGSDEIQSPGGFDRRSWEGLTLGQTVGDFFVDDDAEFAVGIEFDFGVADAAKIEVGAIADVTLVFIRPLDEAVVAVLGFHEDNVTRGFGFWQ